MDICSCGGSSFGCKGSWKDRARTAGAAGDFGKSRNMKMCFCLGAWTEAKQAAGALAACGWKSFHKLLARQENMAWQFGRQAWKGSCTVWSAGGIGLSGAEMKLGE